MKVHIGNYPKTHVTSQIHYNYMNRKYDYIWDANKTKFDKTKLEVFLEKLENTINWTYNHTINQILKHNKRKVKIRIDPWDTWAMHSNLSLIILPMLKQLRDTKHGCPFTDDVDVPKHLRSTAAPKTKNEFDTDDNHEARWDWILNEMIYAFECDCDGRWEDKYFTGETDLRFVKCEDGFSQMVHGPNHTRKLDKKGYMKEYKRIQNGFKLFGKYYQNLWD